ncbi:MAG: hypothetical protein KA105_02585 [Caulobacter sp.]|nr:hypothetical protein [Caulobacter sp.]
MSSPTEGVKLEGSSRDHAHSTTVGQGSFTLATSGSEPNGEMVSVPVRWVVAVNEFLSDWRKGDFELPKLAALDAQAIEEAAR